MGRKGTPFRRGIPFLPKPLLSSLNFPEPGFVYSAYQALRYDAKQSTGNGTEEQTRLRKVLVGWRGWQNIKRSAIARVWWAVVDLFFMGCFMKCGVFYGMILYGTACGGICRERPVCRSAGSFEMTLGGGCKCLPLHDCQDPAQGLVSC